MAYLFTWDEAKPDGATQRGYQLDDEVRTAKKAIRERNEGDSSLTGWCTSFGTTAKPKAGMARVFYDTEANLGSAPLEDGRVFISTDTNRLWHLKGAGAVELAYADPGKSETWTAKQTFNPGTTPQAAVELFIAALTGAGTRDSHNFLMVGQSYDASAHEVDWIWFVDVTSQAGASTLVFQSRIDAAGFATKFSVSDGGTVVAAGSFTGISFTSTVATGTPPLTVTSTTKVSNLNVDKLDDQEGSYYLNASNFNAGTLPDARVAATNVTQHQGALTIAETQISDGSVFPRLAAAEAISGLWTFSHASGIKTDVVTERSADAGVTIDGMVLKDSGWSASGQPRCRAYRGTALSVTSGVNTTCTWNAESFDVGSMHDLVTNTERFTIPSGQGGLYLVHVMVDWTVNTISSRRILRIKKNTGTIVAESDQPNADSGTAGLNQEITTLLSLAAGDYVWLEVYQDSGPTLSVLDGEDTSWMEVVKLA